MRILRKLMMPLALLTSAMLLSAGCASGKRVVLVDPDKTILRAGPDLKGRVYFKNAEGTWELSRNPVTISEGWYLGRID
jgi:hypothetical protein